MTPLYASGAITEAEINTLEAQLIKNSLASKATLKMKYFEDHELLRPQYRQHHQ
jgi:hypothetical protein